jgi:hypothetical protein
MVEFRFQVAVSLVAEMHRLLAELISLRLNAICTKFCDPERPMNFCFTRFRAVLVTASVASSSATAPLNPVIIRHFTALATGNVQYSDGLFTP